MERTAPVGTRAPALALLGLVALATPSHAIVRSPEPPVRGASLRHFDARVNGTPTTRAGAVARGTSAYEQRAQAMANAIQALSLTMPGLEVKTSKEVGGPRSVLNRRGALTPAAPGVKSEDIVRGFLSRNGAIYGLSAADLQDLVVLGDSPGSDTGLRMLRMEQQIDGRPVFQSETRFLLDRDGRLVKTVGLMVPSARAATQPIDSPRLIAPTAAVVRLLAAQGKAADPTAFTIVANNGGRLELSENDEYVAGPIAARQVLFPLAPGTLVPAWSLIVFTSGDEDWYAIVDAETGELLWRKNIRNSVSTHDARFRVYVQADGLTPADNPAPQSPNTVAPGSGTQFPEIAPTIVSMLTAQDILASPNGWIDDCPGGGCTANETQTLGNNVLACLDRTVGGANTNVCDTDANSVLDGNGRPTGNPDANTRNRDFLGTAPRDFQTNFLPPPQAGNPEGGQTATGTGAALNVFRRGAVASLFYITNWYHDKLYRLGFDEASGNFQQTNFSGMGLGGDRVLADAQDGSGTNNANFATPPDGTSGRMQMFRFTGPTIDRDGGLDAEIVFHELTHGTSNRLVGNGAGLNWDPAGGMGEGWSDFYALSLLNNTNADTPSGQYASGAYATYKFLGLLDNYLYGIRRFPYSTNNAVNPMTWADVDDFTNSLTGGIASSPVNFNDNGGMEVHNSGEIWALTLWEVRSRVIADPAGANGNVPTGNNTTLKLVTDGLKMTPIDPTFTEARDAILQADCATNACANEASIWGGFADRGLGYGSKTPYNVAFGFIASHLGIHESFSVPFLDVANAGTDVAINDAASNNNGAIDPGEPILLTVKLTNPWRAASKAVASATATLTSSTPGVTIWDNTSTYGAIAPQGTATGDTFFITVAPSVLCGSALDFTLTTVSSLGTTSTTFQLRVGMASGTDPVQTFTGTPAPPLAMPDQRGRGVTHSINVAADLVIADLDFRIDSATHAFAGDVSFMLRSPGDIGVDFVSLIDGLTDGGGPNITNMVIDDDLASSVAVDMVQATSADAPYTKSWLPVFNAPWPTVAGFPPGDPVGNLSRYDGTSTKGTWGVVAADEIAADTGTLNSWSMLVTPVHFACSAFTPTAVVGATKTVSGTFTVGGTVTYTVILTNTGTSAQLDNPGNEFSDTLPAGLTLVNATATSGTAGMSGNTATWDGTLAPLGGTVTITITATINAGTQGTTISNQGGTSFDADGNGINESSGVTDDPGVAGTTDPTVFGVANAMLSATKTVTGSFLTGSTVTYTVIISNTGSAAQLDNPGNEFTDVLPAALTLVNAIATSGTATPNIGTNTVTWNGSVPASGTVTITITATINPGYIFTVVNNQGTLAYDADANGTNEATAPTDDPGIAGAANPTPFTVNGSVVQIPALSTIGLIALGLGLMLAAAIRLRRPA